MNRIARTLPFLGLAPFVGATGLLYAGMDTLPGLGPVDTLLSSYALLIVAFMAGTHWGLAVGRSRDVDVPLYLPSNVVALTAWFAHLLAPLPVELVVDAAALVVLVVIEHGFARPLGIDDEYLRLRTQVSALAATTVLAASIIV